MEGIKKGFLFRNGVMIGSLKDTIISTCPIGTILSFAGQTVPNGFLLADGASYKIADYPDLYNVIGNTYGGDTENFNVPNLCDGRFLEGSDTSGEYVEAGLPNITGNVGYLKSVANTDLTNEWNGAFKWTTYSASSNIPSQTSSANTYDLEFDASKSNAIYSDDVDTVQPKSLRVLYIIKAFHTNEGVDSGLTDETINLIKTEASKVIDDTATSDKTTWSSSEIKEYVDSTSNPYSGTVIPTKIAKGARITTDWNILSGGDNADNSRLLLLNGMSGSFLVHIRGNLGNTSSIPTTLVSSVTTSQSATWSTDFELSVSSDYKLRIKNKSSEVASWRFM